jgi:transmembrane sensor
MSAFDKLTPEDQIRIEQAALWWHRMQEDASVELSTGFREWVSDPTNTRALDAVERTMGNLNDLGAAPEILDHRRLALTRLRNAGTRRRLPSKAAISAAATLLVVAILAGGAWHFKSRQPTSYATGFGERRVVALSDGSRISLDSDSRVDVRYTKTGRTVTVDYGRARFDVAHDVTRPFTVTAGAETVVAVGTSFNVEYLGSTVLVTLIQGHVLIKGSSSSGSLVARRAGTQKPNPPISLVAGEQLVAEIGTRPVVTNADLDAETAWEAGHLVFRGEPLREAVERVNRYTDHPIVVDPSVASVRISGVFNAGDIGSFVGAITGYFPVQATTDADDTITLQKKF